MLFLTSWQKLADCVLSTNELFPPDQKRCPNFALAASFHRGNVTILLSCIPKGNMRLSVFLFSNISFDHNGYFIYVLLFSRRYKSITEKNYDNVLRERSLLVRVTRKVRPAIVLAL
jgi:hypothetical protein